MKKRFTLLISGFIALLITSSSVLIPAQPAKAWDQLFAGPVFSLHEKMAADALSGLGQEWCSKWGIDNIAAAASAPDTWESIWQVTNNTQHRVKKYHTIKNDGKNDPTVSGTENLVYDLLKTARIFFYKDNFTRGINYYEGRVRLGMAIHYIQDSVCPAHVFPFKESNGPHTTFENYTAYGYGAYAHRLWQDGIENVNPGQDFNPATLTPAYLKNKIQLAADNVFNLKCIFLGADEEIHSFESGKEQIFTDQDLQLYLDNLKYNTPEKWYWYMTDENIGNTMVWAAELVQEAALWATQPGDPPEVGEGTDNVKQMFITCYDRVGGTDVLGDPFTPVQEWGSGWKQEFRGGSAWNAAIIQKEGNDKAYAVYGAILSKYLELGGASGKLGFPTSDEEYVQGSTEDRVNYFENGNIIWLKNENKATEHYDSSGIDLTITSVITNTSLAPGGYAAVSWIVRNNGDTPSVPFSNRISIAPFSNPWGTMVASLGYFPMTSIVAKSFQADTQVVKIPSNITSGSYYITVYADAQNPPNGIITESKENNNIGSTYPQSVFIGTSATTLVVPSDFIAYPVSSSNVLLNWDDKSDNETGFNIERKTGEGGTYNQIASLPSNTEAFSDSGLSENTTYFYRIAAFNAIGNSTPWIEASARTSTVVPLPPSNLTARTVTTGQIDLYWQQNSNNEQGFLIERKEGYDGSFEQIGTVGMNVTQYSCTGLDANKTYFFRAAAYKGSSISQYSNEISAKTLFDPPKAPTSLIATAVSKSQINLVWDDNSSDEDGFIIERKDDPADNYIQIDTTGRNTNKYSNLNLEENTKYFYQVRSYNSSQGNSSAAEAWATTLTEPGIGCSPLNFKFSAIEGSANPSSQVLNIWNTGSEPLDWSVGEYATWLDLDPLNGTTTGDTDTITVSVDISGLTAGSYSTTITINSSDPGMSVLEADVSLLIYPEGSGQVFRVPEFNNNIQFVISIAKSYPGSTVLVSPGIYNGPIQLAEGVNLVGLDKDTTIIETGDGADYAVLGADNARISGFTIKGGYHGINCGVANPPSSPEISDNIITNTNRAIQVGQGASPVIRNNTITGVMVGIYSSASSPVIKNNLIYSNTDWGIELRDGSSAAITNNVIDSTGVSPVRWGIYLSSGSDTSTIQNNIFSNLDIAIHDMNSTGPSLAYNDFFNVETQYRDASTSRNANGTGDLASDPVYINRSSGDFHLSEGSPCIDAGNPANEFLDAFIPPSKGAQRNDMGAFGGPWSKILVEPVVNVLVPNDGEEWHAGSHQDLVWTAVDDITVSTIDIYYSLDGGNTYPNIIATSLSNTGIYIWTPPEILSDNCKIKIVAHDYQGNTGKDESDDIFSIIEGLPLQGTPISGTYSADTTLLVDESPYIATDNILVTSGAKLTIEPGVTICFYPHKSLQIDGELVAIGNESTPIVFTSDANIPAAGDWCGISFMDTSIDAQYNASGYYSSGSIMQYCIVQFAGQDNAGAIRVLNSSPLIDSCQVQNNAYAGIYIDSGSPKIQNNTIISNSGNWGGGIFTHSSDVIIQGNTITENTASSTGGGIYSEYGTIWVLDNDISNNTSSGAAGLDLRQCTAEISNNIVSNNNSSGDVGGIRAHYLISGTITKNEIKNNIGAYCSGLMCTMGSLTIKYNNITGNTGPAGSGGLGIVGHPEIFHNNIYNNIPYNAYVFNEFAEPNTDVQHNWWGTTDPAVISAHIYDREEYPFQGTAVYNPWLDVEIDIEDESSPAILFVIDEGRYISNSNQLSIKWLAADIESGVTEYQYALSFSNISGEEQLMKASFLENEATLDSESLSWTSVGTNTEVVIDDLVLEQDTKYYLNLRAKNNVGLWSEITTSDGIIVDTSSPVSPVVIDDGEYSWNACEAHAEWTAEDAESNISEYQIALGTSPGATDVVDWVSTGTETEKTLAGLDLLSGASYFFSVKAKNGSGLWSDIGASDGIIVDNTPPSIPVINADLVNAVFTATWDSVDSVSGIQQFRYCIGTSEGNNDVLDWQSSGLVKEADVFGISLISGTTYYFSVKCQNGASVWSEVGSSRGLLYQEETLPESPTNLAGNIISSNLVNLSWNDNSDNEQGFRVERKTGEQGSYEQVALPGVDEQNYENSGLDTDTIYFYRVCAFNAKGDSGYSNEISTTTWPPPPETPVLQEPQNGVTISTLTPVLQWNASNNASSYNIQISTLSSFATVIVSQSGLVVTSYSINAGLLNSNTIYYWRVQAFDTHGRNSAWSNAWQFKTPAISTPSNLTATVVSSSQINLNWNDNSNNETGFKIERKAGVSGAYAQIATTGTNVRSHNNTGLTANTTYYYRVCAYNAVGNSTYSNEAPATTQPLPPTVPVLFSPASGSTVASQTPLLQWNAATRATSYNMQISSSSSFITLVVNQTGLTATSYPVAAGVLNWNTTYYWRVQSADTYGQTSAWSSYRYFKTATGPPPGAPSNLVAAAVSSSQINLSWNDNSNNETGFKIERKAGVSGAYAQIATTGANVHSYNNTGLTANTTYYYRVCAYNAVGNSAYSNEVPTTTQPLPPTVPVLFSPASGSTVASQTPLLQWNAATRATSYNMQISSSSSFITLVVNQTGLTATSYPVAAGVLNWNTTYYWRVQSADTYGQTSAWSSYCYFKTATGPPPGPPSNLTATVVSSSQINLNWNDNSNNETGFKIERKAGVSGAYAQIATTGANVHSYNNTGLTANTTYYYRVCAYNAVGNSAYSNEVPTTTQPLPPTVPVLFSPASGSTVASQTPLLQWNAATRVTSYNLQISTSSSFITQVINQTGLTATSYPVAAGVLNWNTTYYWRVQSADTYGQTSAWSSYRYFKTATGPPPGAPSNLVAAAVSSSQINLSWNDNSNNETGFKIERKAGVSGAYAQIATTGANVHSYNNTGLTANTTYYYRVCAYNAVGNSAYSNEVPTTTQPLPPTVPVLFSPASGSTVASQTPLLQWNAATRATSYNMQISSSSSFITLVVNQTGLTATSYPVAAGVLNWNTTYYWRVQSADTYGQTSAWSSYRYFKTATGPPPGAPSNLVAAAVSSSQINLSWNDNSNNETGFKIERKAGVSGAYAQIATTGANVHSYNNTGLTANTTYYYRVCAYNAVGNSAYSNEVPTTTQPLPPTVPVLFSPASGSTVASQTPLLQWNAATRATSYNMQISSSSSFITLVVNQTGLTATSYPVAAGVLNWNTTYYWRVQSADTYGQTSAWSSYRYFKTATGPPPGPPSNLTATVVSSSQINLNWNDNSNNETGFKIERKAGVSGAYAQIATTGANVHSYNNTGLTANTTYYYRVCAYNAVGNSAYSNEVPTTTQPLPPTVPVLFSPASGSTVASQTPLLQWNAATRVTSYNMQISTSSSFITQVINQTGLTATSYPVAAGVLNWNTTYYWRVQSADTYGQTSAWSSYRYFKTATGP